MDRKEFLEKSALIASMVCLGMSVSCEDDPSGLNKQITIDLSDPEFEKLNTESSWMLHPDENVLIVNVAGDFRAFDSRCPHSSCSRNWAYNPGVFTCTCHNSKFDSTGAYLSGPANASLTLLNISLEGTILTIG